MTGEELRDARIALGLTQKEFADILETTPNTVARWERGELKINQGWAKLGLAEAKRRKVPVEEGRRGPRSRRSEDA